MLSSLCRHMICQALMVFDGIFKVEATFWKTLILTCRFYRYFKHKKSPKDIIIVHLFTSEFVRYFNSLFIDF